MGRLYWRILLAFWGVILISIVGTALLNTQFDRARQAEGETTQRAERFALGLKVRAERLLARDGPEALAAWSQQQSRRNGRIRVLIIDGQGRELNGQRWPRSASDLIRAWLAGGDLPSPGPELRHQLPLEHPQHGRFLLLVVSPPAHLLIRWFGPLGLPGLLLVAVLASLMISLLLTRTLTRPLAAIRESGRALGQGELSARVAPGLVQRRDEVGDLARDFNRMADRIQSLLESQQQLLRDVSHELRSPLARLRVGLALAADARDSRDRARHINGMERDLERLDQLIEEILEYARLKQAPVIEMGRFDLAEVVASVVESARLEAGPTKVRIEDRVPEQLFMYGNAALLARAVDNVLRNALAHSRAGQSVRIALDQTADQIQLEIADQGPGVPEHQLETIFEPFVRLSPERGESGPGGGIGLAIVKAAVERHGGRVSARNRAGQGLRVEIDLSKTPAAD